MRPSSPGDAYSATQWVRVEIWVSEKSVLWFYTTLLTYLDHASILLQHHWFFCDAATLLKSITLYLEAPDL